MLLSERLLGEITGCPEPRVGSYKRDRRRAYRFAASARALILRLADGCFDRPIVARYRRAR